MNPLLMIPLGFAPGLFLLWYFYQKGIYHPEPKRLVARAFAIGMAITIPAAIVESLILPEELLELGNIAVLSAAAFLVIGPVEEGLKFMTIRLGPYKFFDEPVDGILYAAAVALGFASVENVFYMLQYGWEVIIIRGPVSTLGHVFFAVPAGYYLGLRAVGRASNWAVAVALVITMCLHGAFDFFLFTRTGALAAFPLLVIAGIWTSRTIKQAQQNSPLKGRLTSLFVRCPQCGNRALPFHRYCTKCGNDLQATVHPVLVCGNCSAMNSPVSSYCTSCGYRLLRQ